VDGIRKCMKNACKRLPQRHPNLLVSVH